MAVNKESKSGWHEAWGVILIAFGVLLLLSLLSYSPDDVPVLHSPANDPPANFIGPMGAWLAFGLLMGFGVAAYLVPAMLMILGGQCLLRRHQRIGTRVLWLMLMLMAAACVMDLRGDWVFDHAAERNFGLTGGIVGAQLGREFCMRVMGDVGTLFLAWMLLVAGLLFVLEIRVVSLWRALCACCRAVYRGVNGWVLKHMDERARLEKERREIEKKQRKLERALKRDAGVEREEAEAPPPRKRLFRGRGDEAEAAAEAQAPAPRRTMKREMPEQIEAPLVVEKTKRSAPPPEETQPVAARKTKVMVEKSPGAGAAAEAAPAFPEVDTNRADGTPWRLPPMELLDPLPVQKDTNAGAELAEGRRVLEATLAEFGIEAEVTHAERGPVVTSYEILPAPGIKVEKIAGLSNNIALSMKAQSVRVQAPIPGKGVVGIEVPNGKSTVVYLRHMLESTDWARDYALPLCLGQDVSGSEIVADLADMPHMLIAGATGSGKTVCMNSILAGLLMKRTPDQMRLMLVDPKIVEFSGFNHLPHLVVPVITDPKKVGLGLRWAINEMEKRYKLFAKVGVRNIKSFNSRPIEKQEELFGDEPAPEKKGDVPTTLPYIVLVVDELADLMMVAQAEIEGSIARLAQLSRAVGIHMILATQRPSVNVITGTIKANFPARVAFQVAQRVDSKTILDTIGAEKLLGKGDMLFMPPGSPKLIRAQGAFTRDHEMHKIIEFLKEQGTPSYETAIKDKIEGKTVEMPEAGEDDELLPQAVEIIRQTRRASTSSLQRRLRIGYTRAARLMDLLEEKGVVGPPNGSDPREILIDLDGDIPENDEDGDEGALPIEDDED